MQVDSERLFTNKCPKKWSMKVTLFKMACSRSMYCDRGPLNVNNALIRNYIIQYALGSFTG